MKKAPWYRFFRTKKFIALVVVLFIVGGIAWAKTRPQKPSFEDAAAQKADVIEIVSVTGTILPSDRADLAFKKGGVISDVYVKVGDRVTAGQPIASLDASSDKAALAAAQATLADMSRTLTPEELAVQKAALASAQKDAVNAALTALTTAQNAVFNYADSFYKNAQSPNPNLSLYTASVNTEIRLENERLAMTTLFGTWSNALAQPKLSASDAIRTSVTDMTQVKAFMDDLSGAVAALSNGSSGLSQTAINADTTTMNSGSSAVNAGLTAATASETALASAQSTYDLKLAGNSADSIAAQAARVAGAQADLNADTLVSPMDGIVTQADPTVGEYVAPGQSGFAVQDSSYKIEAYVPEADIAKVAVGDLASSTLDAYGPDVDFPAAVVMIDPAETVIEGVPTYKVTLHFISPDQRIRSGMTANLDIHTHERRGVLAIPYRAVTDDNGAKSVKLVSPDGLTYTTIPVTTGLKGSNGLIEITSGLNEGDKVVTYSK